MRQNHSVGLVKAVARKVLGRSYGAVSEVLSQERLASLERRVTELEERTQRDIANQLAQLLYSGVSGLHRSLQDHELKVFSQNGEDGILLRLIAETGCPNRRLAEIGVGDGTECNSANLIMNWGWTGVLIEGDPAGAANAAELHRHRVGVSVRNDFVTAENINELLPPEPIDLVSLDIDGNDYWVWKAMAARPLVFVVEYNASLGPVRSVTIPYDPTFDYSTASEHRMYHGASLAALEKLGGEKGMSLVGCDSRGVNAFFVRSDLAGDGLARRTAAQAWRPIQKRLRRWSQEEQEQALRSFDFVEV